MKQTLITTALALGLGFISTPSFATGYIVNGHAASPAEAQHLVASGVQQGAWVVNEYGIAPAERAFLHSSGLHGNPDRQEVLLRPGCAALRLNRRPHRALPDPTLNHSPKG